MGRTADYSRQSCSIAGTLEVIGDPKTLFPDNAATVEAARRLVAQGKLVITQQGHEVDPSTARGPVRLRLR